jgi:hypothetical protein
MLRLRGHYDGSQIVLDQPAPPELKANTPVEIVVAGEREQVLAELLAFWDEWSSRPLPPDFDSEPRQWKREDLYDERCQWPR